MSKTTDTKETEMSTKDKARQIAENIIELREMGKTAAEAISIVAKASNVPETTICGAILYACSKEA